MTTETIPKPQDPDRPAPKAPVHDESERTESLGPLGLVRDPNDEGAVDSLFTPRNRPTKPLQKFL